MDHCYQDLIAIFNDCFLLKYNTLLVKGEDEPLYLPADETRPQNELFFAHGFFASALHEASHWLIAGEKRRKLVDFGYWYQPDGRSPEQQALFQSVEIKPQAMEWILSRAAGSRFRVSIDNLNGSEIETDSFNLETAIQDDKVMQDFDLESLLMGADHSLWVKAAPIESDYGSKGCVNLPSSIAVSRFKKAVWNQVKTYCENGLSERANTFRNALCHFYGTSSYLRSEDFDIRDL